MATQPEDDFEEEEVDIEELVKQGKRVPRAKRYRIRMDKERFVVTTPFITKAELLSLVGKTATSGVSIKSCAAARWTKSPIARRWICGSGAWNAS